jgi:hypothetical protein
MSPCLGDIGSPTDATLTTFRSTTVHGAVVMYIFSNPFWIRVASPYPLHFAADGVDDWFDKSQAADPATIINTVNTVKTILLIVFTTEVRKDRTDSNMVFFLSQKRAYQPLYGIKNHSRLND